MIKWTRSLSKFEVFEVYNRYSSKRSSGMLLPSKQTHILDFYSKFLPIEILNIWLSNKKGVIRV